jgi:hypothetical protein
LASYLYSGYICELVELVGPALVDCRCRVSPSSRLEVCPSSVSTASSDSPDVVNAINATDIVQVSSVISIWKSASYRSCSCVADRFVDRSPF